MDRRQEECHRKKSVIAGMGRISVVIRFATVGNIVGTPSKEYSISYYYKDGKAKPAGLRHLEIIGAVMAFESPRNCTLFNIFFL